MKYFAALAVLAIPLALTAGVTPAEAGYRDGFRCHVVKKTFVKYGKKRVRFVKVCRKKHDFKKKHHVRNDYRHDGRRDYDRRR